MNNNFDKDSEIEPPLIIPSADFFFVKTGYHRFQMATNVYNKVAPINLGRKRNNSVLYSIYL